MELGCTPIRLAVAISGRGRTLANLIKKNYLILHVFSSTYLADGLKIAQENGIETTVVNEYNMNSDSDIYKICRDKNVDLLCLAGYMRKTSVPEDFKFRVMNIHPSLIPSFCGQGFYGHKVHQAVLDRGCKVSGCTVHFVDDDYDHGPIILQRVVDVNPQDTYETLADKVFEAEMSAYPEAIDLYSQGRISCKNNIVTILPTFE